MTSAASPRGAKLDPELISRASGAEPSLTDDGAVRVGWSRTDAKVTVDGIHFFYESPRVFFMHIGGAASQKC